MKVSCQCCHSVLNLDEKKIPPGGARIKCPVCQTVFPVKPSEPVALPVAASVPLPGGAAPLPDEAEDATVALPPASIPGATTLTAPPTNAPTFARSSPSGTMTVPLPSAAALGLASAPAPTMTEPETPAVPLPGLESPLSSPFDFAPPPEWTEERTPGVPAVPLPGAYDFSGEPALPSVPSLSDDAAVALPGPQGEDWGHTAPLPPPLTNAQDLGPGVPLPGGADFDFGMPGETIPLPSLTEEPQPLPVTSSAGAFDFGAPPPAFSFDAPAPALPSTGPLDFDLSPQPRGEFDFGRPPGDAPGGLDFAAISPPPGNEGAGAFDFGAPPASDAAAPNFDFGLPPPAAAEPASDVQHPQSGLDFGEVDFGAPQSPFEPLPSAAPSGSADGDKVQRFHIKRRSGKVFGPFEETAITQMLKDGQLLGNEELSIDGEQWHAMSAEPAFQGVLTELSHTTAPAEPATAPAAAVAVSNPSLDRMKQIYEGRMAAVAVVRSKEKAPLKVRLAVLGVGVAVAAILATGIGLGFATPYGFFGLKVLLPTRIRPDTREFGYLQVAKKGFLQDTWLSYKTAKESAQQALKINEFPEARAVWVRAVYALDRKFGRATPEELAEIKEAMGTVHLLGDKHPEVQKTEASAALSRQEPDVALALLSDVLARDGDDLEAQFLRAEAYVQKKQLPQAKVEFETILKKAPTSAKALHELGLILKQQGDPVEATRLFTAALEADPAHVTSAIELAHLALAQKKIDEALELVGPILSEEHRTSTNPNTVGIALALKAQASIQQGKESDAIALFEEALKQDPKSPFINGALAEAYTRQGQPEKAAPLFALAAKAQPENLELAQGYLANLIATDKLADAKAFMAQASARFPGNAVLAYLSARIADAQDNAKEAEDGYKRALAADPQLIDASLALSRLYLRFRRIEEARPFLETAIQAAPENGALHAGLGEVALFERNWAKAEFEFNKATELDSNLAEAFLGSSKVALAQGNVSQAAALVEKALKVRPHLAGGRLQRGIVSWKLGRLDEAIAELETAREEEPKNVHIVVALGEVKFAKGDLNGALSHLNTALLSDANQPEAHFALARVKNARGEHTQAIDAIRRALDSNSKSPLYLYWYGRILTDARRSEDALVELQHALDLNPKYADALEAMARIYFERNDFTKAIGFYEQALKADPNLPKVRALMGDAKAKNSDWAGAIASYLDALNREPKEHSLFARLGLAHQEKGDSNASVMWYRKAVEAEPENADAWLALGYLCKDTGKKKDAATAFRQYLELRPEAENKREVEDELEYLK